MAFLDELRNSMGGGSPTKGAAKSVDPNDLKDLGLGGLPSFLGTREDAAAGKRGDAQIAATLTDSLPGYFNPETRDYVPWYVDLFDGGGINRSAGMLDAGSNAQGQAVGGVMSPMQPEGLLANNQFSDMERMQRANPLEPFGGSGPAIQDTPDTSYYTPPSSMQTPTPAGPGMPGYTPPSSMQMPAPASAATPFTPAPESTPRLSEMQTPMMQHPAFPQFVDIMKRMGNESVLQDPSQASLVFNNYLKQIGY